MAAAIVGGDGGTPQLGWIAKKRRNDGQNHDCEVETEKREKKYGEVKVSKNATEVRVDESD